MENGKKRVLLVDDFPDNREMYAHFLAARGFQVALAADGQEALDKAFELHPDVVILDLSLPVVSGWDVARRLRADEKTKDIPILILTAHDFPGMSAAVGCDGVLTKPCLPDKMVQEISRVLNQRVNET